MKSFQNQLNEDDINKVALFVYEVFVKNKQENTRYHTVENGWTDHDKYRDAFPFALGEISIDTPWEKLTEAQKRGKELFMRSCISCHDRASVDREGAPWESRPLSYPRNNYSHKKKPVDAVSAASPMAIHDEFDANQNIPLTKAEKLGEKLFIQNCAFCHGQDGRGKNWIGSFIEPHPRDISDKAFLKQNDAASLAEKISEGVPGSAMPAWKTVLTQSEIKAIVSYLQRKFMGE